MSAISAAAGTLDAARRRTLLELLRRELRAAHAGLLGAGAAPPAVSRMLDERISLLAADSLLAEEQRALARAVRSGGDDAKDVVDGLVDVDGVG
jgi:hypothetical protein